MRGHIKFKAGSSKSRLLSAKDAYFQFRDPRKMLTLEEMKDKQLESLAATTKALTPRIMAVTRRADMF
jgi:hypothetical protein